jgi:hypothetical protein
MCNTLALALIRRHCEERSDEAIHFFVIPGRCEASNPESRDSGSGAGAPSRNDEEWIASLRSQ